MTQRLGDLVRGLGIQMPEAAADVEVGGVSHDSRRVEAGDLFVALVGEHSDGRQFVSQAVERGAVAVLGHGPAPGGLGEIPWLEAPAPRRLLGRLAARAYGDPQERLTLVGVTGTNGKSTVVALVADILDAVGRPAGVMGTLGYHFSGHRWLGTGRTTPEASDLYRALEGMADAGAEAVALEVSSHALDLGRVDGLAFDVAVFTNLTRDHLDFHGDMETYFATKRRLFKRLRDGGKVVVGIFDDWGRRLAADLPEALTFGRDSGDVHVAAADLTLRGTRARIVTPRGELEIETPLLGRYNLDNVLAAVAVAEALGLPHGAVATGLGSTAPVPGRLERVDAGQGFPVFVDYAHTPGALEACLRSLRELTDRKLVVVFGCGGLRDRGKRPQMGRIAGELADLPVITSDNPRGEDAQAIVAEVEAGVRESGNELYRVLPDRGEAIRRAVHLAVQGEATGEPWLLLVAGKGHETFQDFGDRRIPFSDREQLETAIRNGQPEPVGGYRG
ncbi:MAG: UDP-N-acetylmuramoyl-L-alanyl-D-glutamate--2,6-diaminopimelate ligase [Acidobacteriota bacterium]